MGFFTGTKKITSLFKKPSKKNKRKNIKTRTLTPYNKFFTIEENEELLTSEHDSTPDSPKLASLQKKTSSSKRKLRVTSKRLTSKRVPRV